MTHLNRQLLLTGSILLAGAMNVSAQSADALINKLVEKGILNMTEANELKQEADDNFKSAVAIRTGMPEWMSTLKLSGDLRLRYDGIYSDLPGLVDRHRGRFRLRYGVTATLAEKFEVGFRLASSTSTGGNSGGDPVSTNETFGNNGNRKPIGIDQAYVRWTPVESTDWSASFVGGKFGNPFTFSEMVFDGDYTPEGLAQQFSYNISEEHEAQLILGQFLLDEVSGGSRDAYMLAVQARLDSEWNDQWESTIGIAALSILNPRTLTSSAVPDIGRGNTRNAAGVLLHDYNLVVADAEVTYLLESAPFYRGQFPISFQGEYIYNFGAPSRNTAFGFGPTFGKAGKRGTWEFSVKYKEMQADAMYEETVDSDYGAFYFSNPPYEPSNGFPAYFSGTNVRGPVFRFSYAPYDFLTLSAMYAMTELIDEVPPGSKSDGSRLILDAVLKF